MRSKALNRLFFLLFASVLAATVTLAQPAQKPTAPSPSLVSISAGALIVAEPESYPGWPALNIIDESPESGFATNEGVISNQTIVIGLPEQTLLKTLTFDLASTDGPGRGAKGILVEMSDTSAEAGFKKIAQVTLKDRQNNQSFPVQAEVPGRWVRLTLQNNQGASDYLELMDFRATGTQLTHTAVANISGTYSTNYGDFHVRQEGASLSGCYEYQEGVLSGGMEGRLLKFTWREGESKGPAIMVITPDGQKLFGIWWHEGQTEPAGVWNGEKIKNEVGSCPHWSGGAAEQLTKDLEELGRARVYGINFDTDSAIIRAESKGTLDKIVAVLKAKAEWRMTIEGHTDSTGSAAHNQTLSEQRAQAVRDYLQKAGIEAARLQAVGLGASKPVATNATELGRSQNRRVELVKQ